MLVGPGTYVVMVETTAVVQLAGTEVVVQSPQTPSALVVVAGLTGVVVVVVEVQSSHAFTVVVVATTPALAETAKAATAARVAVYFILMVGVVVSELENW